MGLSFFAGERGTGDPGESMGLVGREKDRQTTQTFKIAVVGRIARQGQVLLGSSRAEISSVAAM